MSNFTIQEEGKNSTTNNSTSTNNSPVTSSKITTKKNISVTNNQDSPVTLAKRSGKNIKTPVSKPQKRGAFSQEASISPRRSSPPKKVLRESNSLASENIPAEKLEKFVKVLRFV